MDKTKKVLLIQEFFDTSIADEVRRIVARKGNEEVFLLYKYYASLRNTGGDEELLVVRYETPMATIKLSVPLKGNKEEQVFFSKEYKCPAKSNEFLSGEAVLEGKESRQFIFQIVKDMFPIREEEITEIL